jgi:GrpB-like predicted nucleotidyltransferase (UPF0157 family)
MKTLTLSRHQSIWSEQYLFLKQEIESLMGEGDFVIHHIGSTAIQGLVAKPVIDILVEIKDVTMIDNNVDKWNALNFVNKGENGIANRRYLYKGECERIAQVHIYSVGDPNIERHIAVRDYLISHSKEASKYAQVKKEGFDRANGNSKYYVNYKAKFMAQLEQKALLWWNRKSSS